MKQSLDHTPNIYDKLGVLSTIIDGLRHPCHVASHRSLYIGRIVMTEFAYLSLYINLTCYFNTIT